MKTVLKQFIIFGAILGMLALISVPPEPAYPGTFASSQTVLPYGEILTFTSTGLDSARIDTSSTFDMNQYGGVDWTDLPFAYSMKRTPSPATIDSANVIVRLFRSMDGSTWVLADTIYSYAAATVTTGTAYGTTDFNDVKYPYYRVDITELAKEQKTVVDTSVTWILKIWRTGAMR